jgi:glycosyltransferase involved in cell wall biosynthesis
MKVLVIPPEPFVPEDAPLSAIFQYHQAVAVERSGVQVAVISVTPPIALKPLLISLVRRMAGRRTYYTPVRGMGVRGIWTLLWARLWSGEECATEVIDGLLVLRLRLPCWSDIGPEAELAYFEACVLRGYRLLSGAFGRPDLIHAHNAWLAGTAALVLSRSERLPYCLTEHSTYYSRGLIPERLYPRLREVYAQAGCNLVVSPSLGALLSGMGLLPTGHRVMPNLLDPYFEAAALVAPAPQPPVSFLNVAELTEKKGQDILLRAFAAAFGGDATARLVIAGEGALDEELRRLTETLGIGGRVSFPGRLTRPQVLEAMRACHVFVLPSRVETFGVVVIEAQACGRPVVATVCGGPEDIVTEADGVLVPPGDVEALAEALLSVRRRLSAYDPGRIRATALGRYGSGPFTDSLLAVYGGLLRGAAKT